MNKNNYAVYREAGLRLVGIVINRNNAYIPGWGMFKLGLFNFEAAEKDAEECEKQLEKENMYFNHEVGPIVPNDFDLKVWGDENGIER